MGAKAMNSGRRGAVARHGALPHNKDQIKSEGGAGFSVPGARKDEAGSRHNEDKQRAAKGKQGPAREGRADLAAREVGQDTRKAKGRAHLDAQAAAGRKPRRGQKHSAKN